MGVVVVEVAELWMVFLLGVLLESGLWIKLILHEFNKYFGKLKSEMYVSQLPTPEGNLPVMVVVFAKLWLVFLLGVLLDSGL